MQRVRLPDCGRGDSGAVALQKVELRCVPFLARDASMKFRQGLTRTRPNAE